MQNSNFRRIKVNEACCFLATVQVFAFGMTITVAPVSSAFYYHLAGFTVLLQGMAIVVGCGWCLYCLYGKLNADSSALRIRVCGVSLAGGSALAAGSSVLCVYGHCLPGLAGELPFTGQLAGSMFTAIISLYVGVLRYRSRQLHRNMVEMRQSGLTYRLRHHFLFNSLNTTACLIPSRPDIANNNLVELSQLFRLMLQQEATVTLMQEIDFAKCYIRIERVRLGDRLRVEWNLPGDEVLQEKIPSMVIQPLVENAIYHGVEACSEGGIIRITIKAYKDRILFDIRNPVCEERLFPGRIEGNRLAQRSIAEKLYCFYGIDSRLDCQQRCGEYCAAFFIPRKII